MNRPESDKRNAIQNGVVTHQTGFSELGLPDATRIQNYFQENSVTYLVHGLLGGGNAYILVPRIHIGCFQVTWVTIISLLIKSNFVASCRSDANFGVWFSFSIWFLGKLLRIYFEVEKISSLNVTGNWGFQCNIRYSCFLQRDTSN